MTGAAITKLPRMARPSLFDQLVVRSDVFNHNNLLYMTVAEVAVSFFALLIPSETLAMVVIKATPAAVFLAWMIPSLGRFTYYLGHPYASARWLAAVRAAYGSEIIDRIIDELRRTWSPDHIISQTEIMDGITKQRRALKPSTKAIQGIRLRDIAEHG